MKVFLKYLLFQIPQWLILGLFLWILVRTTAVPLWPMPLFLTLWIIKDLLLYPWERKAYSNDAKTGAEKLVGGLAVAQQRLDREGYVKVDGELWKARAARDEIIEPGTVVKIRDATGLTLIVEPEPAERSTLS